MNLLPVFTALIAVVLLGEHLQVFHLVGGGLTLCGIFIGANYPKANPMEKINTAIIGLTLKYWRIYS